MTAAIASRDHWSLRGLTNKSALDRRGFVACFPDARCGAGESLTVQVITINRVVVVVVVVLVVIILMIGASSPCCALWGRAPPASP